jgi:hypothetical protein
MAQTIVSSLCVIVPMNKRRTTYEIDINGLLGSSLFISPSQNHDESDGTGGQTYSARSAWAINVSFI